MPTSNCRRRSKPCNFYRRLYDTHIDCSPADTIASHDRCFFLPNPMAASILVSSSPRQLQSSKGTSLESVWTPLPPRFSASFGPLLLLCIHVVNVCYIVVGLLCVCAQCSRVWWCSSDVCRRSHGVHSRWMFFRRRGRIPLIDYSPLVNWALALILYTDMSSKQAILAVPSLQGALIPTALQQPLATLCISISVSLPTPSSVR